MESNTELQITGIPLNIKDILSKISLDTFTKITFNDCGLTDEDVIILTNKLQSNTSVTELNIIHGTVYKNGINAIANLIKYNNTIQKLNISDLFCINFMPIIEAFEYNKSIINLNLSYNMIDNNHYVCLNNALKINNTLQYLNLRHTNSQEMHFGIWTLCTESLIINTSLLDLDLSHNSFYNETVYTIHELQNINQLIQIII
jgi:hypothetical protein